MKLRVFALLALLGVSGILFNGPFAFSEGGKDTKGGNVKLVVYAKGGQVGGAFMQKGPKGWLEYNDDGRHDFTEINRDEWSVYLANKGGSYEVQIDLFNKKILYTEKGKPQAELYRVLKAYN